MRPEAGVRSALLSYPSLVSGNSPTTNLLHLCSMPEIQNTPCPRLMYMSGAYEYIRPGARHVIDRLARQTQPVAHCSEGQQGPLAFVPISVWRTLRLKMRWRLHWHACHRVESRLDLGAASGALRYHYPLQAFEDSDHLHGSGQTHQSETASFEHHHKASRSGRITEQSNRGHHSCAGPSSLHIAHQADPDNMAHISKSQIDIVFSR